MPSIGRRIKAPAMKDVPTDNPKAIGWMSAVTDYINLREGNSSPQTNSRFVTIQDLVDAGVVPDGKIL